MGNFISASQDTPVGIVTRLRAGRPRNRGSFPGEGKRIVSSAKIPDRILGPPGFLFKRYRKILSPGEKRPMPEFNHLHHAVLPQQFYFTGLDDSLRSVDLINM